MNVYNKEDKKAENKTKKQRIKQIRNIIIITRIRKEKSPGGESMEIIKQHKHSKLSLFFFSCYVHLNLITLFAKFIFKTIEEHN